MGDAAAPNLASLLFEHPAADAEPLLYSPRTTWTAAEARGAAAASADRLRAAVVAPGAPVGVCAADGAEAVIAMAGIWSQGGVVVPVNHRMPEAEAEAVLERSGAIAVVEGERVRALGGTVRHARGTALVLWTSGTTGAPKPLLHTHAGYLEILDRVLGPLGGGRDRSRPPMPNLIPVSMALNAGIYNALFGLRAGAPLVFMDRFTADDFAALVARHGIRSTVLPPAALAMLTDAEDVIDLAPLRRVRSITAPLSPVVARRFTERFGVDVLNGYGQAEMGEVIGWTASDLADHADKIGSVGRPHPGVDVRVDDPDANGVGELLVRPPSRAGDESGGGDLADRVTADGFVHTGDLARIDGEGFVWIEGRLGDVINRGGNKVYPDHVEDALRAVPGVVDVAVAGLPDDRLGEVPVAFVVSDRVVDDEELDAACRERLVAYKVPVAYRRVDEIPRSEVGKILRRELSARP